MNPMLLMIIIIFIVVKESFYEDEKLSSFENKLKTNVEYIPEKNKNYKSY